MANPIGRVILHSLLWLGMWVFCAFTQWSVYLQHREGRVTRNEGRLQRRNVGKLWVLLSGLPSSAGKVVFMVMTFQVQMLVYAVIVLGVGLFVSHVDLDDFNLCLFITAWIPGEVISWFLQKTRGGQSSALQQHQSDDE